jgi:5S rRNA maturation endonuclease (ribonuclease M5)
MGIKMADLFSDDGATRRIVGKYPYIDEDGKLLYQNVRFDPKDFRLRRPNGKGGWTWNLGDVRRVLYRLQEVLAAKEVLLVEGEKDADTGTNLGFTATTSGASGSWKDEFADHLRGKRVTIVADADDAGRSHAQTVARSLSGNVDSLKLLEVPCAKDLSEWVEHGGRREGLLELIEKTSEWKPEYIDGSAVLDRVLAYIRRFVSLSESQARVVALWTVHTYLLAATYATPYLAITSVEKQSGKTRVLEVLETLVANAWLTGRVSAAVLIRKIDAEHPTLLLDESDAAFGGEKEYAEALRGILNTGHRRGGKSSCCDRSGANFSFRDFSTFCPKAIAGIGKLPDTVADRSIPIRLRRAAPGDRIERFRPRDIEAEAANLREQLEKWCSSIGPMLPSARPELPDALTDRQQDGAEPLLAIADAAGGDWPEAVRRALVELCIEAQVSDDSVGKQLLTDILNVFQLRSVDRLPSAELVAALVEIETSPWSEWLHGKPLTATRLAKLLKGHEIAPRSIRIGDQTPKGYMREDFRDAFLRYLRIVDTWPQSATTQQTNPGADFDGFSSRNTEAAVADGTTTICNENGLCGVVAAPRLAEAVCGAGIEEDL